MASKKPEKPKEHEKRFEQVLKRLVTEPPKPPRKTPARRKKAAKA